ncbi:hypothetical protein ABW19_dt0202709 [Dactylella cylindrospora]|nr:hypothetical protein ABW19_dt0202709 [Dactylella cylindrospora]
MLGIDTGRPASTMTYNFQQHQGQMQAQPQQQQQGVQISRGMVTSSFSNRGKGETIRKISIPSLPTISTSSYDDERHNLPSGSPFPGHRGSSRSQLLAGLRTAPKTPTLVETSENTYPPIGVDASQPQVGWARPNSTNFTPGNQKVLSYGGFQNTSTHSSIQSNFSRPSPEIHQEPHHMFSNAGKFNGLPTPPASSAYANHVESDYEAKVYAELLARNISLAQQQQILKQQMRIVQQAQQLQQVQAQMQQLHIQSPISQPLGTPPISPAVYSPSSSGLPHAYSFYNSQTGATPLSYVSQQYSNYSISPQVSIPSEESSAAFLTSTLTSSSPPKNSPLAPSPPACPSSPPKDPVVPKKTPSPPSALVPTFRKGHKKCSSLSSCINASASIDVIDGGPKTSVPRLSNIPSTPINSTFGGRGDHPIRQPRGPPALEEILARPTAKHEGSKNFSSRQRRRALSKLVNAGIERRGAKPVNASLGGMVSVSEHDVLLCFDEPRSTSSSPRGSGHTTPLSHSDEDIRVSIPNRNGLGIPRPSSTSEKRRSALF